MPPIDRGKWRHGLSRRPDWATVHQVLKRKGVGRGGGRGDQLTQIESESSRVTDVMRDFVAASDQQANGIDAVNHAVAQLNTMTQQVASNAEHSAAASEELGAQAVTLIEIVETFTLEARRAARGQP